MIKLAGSNPYFLNASSDHSKAFSRVNFRWLFLVFFALLISFGASAQNTKGDTPDRSRESRFKSTPRKEKKKVRPAKRVTVRTKTQGGERAGKPLKPLFNVHKPSNQDRAWKGDLTGRRIRQRNSSSQQVNVHPQKGPHVKRNPPNREGKQNVARGRPVRVQSATGKARNVYPQRGRYVNASPKPRDTERVVSNRQALAKLRKIQSDGRRRPGDGGRGRVVPRSASSPFIRHKSINVWANFPRTKRKGEQAQTTDIAGRKIRGRNFETPRRGFIPAPNTYRGRQAIRRDRPYTGPSGGYRTASGGGRAWRGDIAGRRIRHRDRSSKKRIEGTPSLASRPRSISGSGRRGSKFPGAASVSGRVWNNSGRAIAGRTPKTGIPGLPVRMRSKRGFRDQGEGFPGLAKSRRPVKGGGSVSGGWNNNGRPVVGRTPKTGIPGFPIRVRSKRGFRDQGEGFAGSVKSRRPAKGGGSVSGGWNNNGRPVVGRTPKTGIPAFPVKQRLPRELQDQGEEFTGMIKSHRPKKGGGSVSGKLWNNNERPIPVRQYSGSERVAGYAGNIKVKGRGPSNDARRAAAFQGNRKIHSAQPPISDQGEEFTGFKRLSRFRRNYIQNELANENSIKKKRPGKSVYAVRGLQVKVKRRPYVENENAADDALKKLKPTAADKSVAGLQVKVRQDRYVRNPSSSRDALKVREPGRAFARITDYQGNIKMQKYRFANKHKGLHPDAQFVRTNKNNVPGERDAVTNFKLWWARLFKKQDTQPDHLKEKGKKPRYDKGEIGLWYD